MKDSMATPAFRRTAAILCMALFCHVATVVAQTRLPGFTESPQYAEQVMNFVYEPGVSVHINAPAAEDFNADKPTRLMIFALPNTNRTHWCIGKKKVEGDDFHFQLLHIGAQTHYIRQMDKEHNFVTIYLEPNTLVWGKWRRSAEGRDLIIRTLVEKLHKLFAAYNPHIELNGHSGGGSFIFGFMDGGAEIPDYVKRISFIDSNYNWTRKKYGEKLERWMEASAEHQLSVICYDDGNALTQSGKPVISRKDGTFHRSKLMLRFLKRRLDKAQWKRSENGNVVEYRTANSKQAYFFFRKNPERKIYHAPLGELNGYIQSAFSNTKYENKGYKLMGERAYEKWIEDEVFEPEKSNSPF